MCVCVCLFITVILYTYIYVHTQSYVCAHAKKASCVGAMRCVGSLLQVLGFQSWGSYSVYNCKSIGLRAWGLRVGACFLEPGARQDFGI